MSETKPEVVALYQSYLAATDGNAAAAASLAAADVMLSQRPTPRGTAITPKQVAERLGVTLRTVYRLCDEGSLQCRRITTGAKGRGILRIGEEALIRFLGEVECDRKPPLRKAGRRAS